MTSLELCCMTVRQAGLEELVTVARDAGFSSVTATARLIQRSGLAPADIRARLEHAGVRLGYLDGLSSPLPGTPEGLGEEECFTLLEGLGTDTVNVVHFGGGPTPRAEMTDAVGAVAERAGRRGLRILIEFLPGTGIPDLPTAAAIVSEVGLGNLAILLDTWHLARSGGMGAVPDPDQAALVGALQVSDRAASQDLEPYVPMSNRLLPGEGELPLAETLRTVLEAHPQMTVGVEVINDSLRSLPAGEAAGRAGRAVRGVLEEVRGCPARGGPPVGA